MDQNIKPKRPAIAMQPVQSSQIRAVGYDADSKLLAVQFTRGSATYYYPGVAPEEHAAFIGAKSLGVHFGQNFKRRAFEKELPEPDSEPKDPQP